MCSESAQPVVFEARLIFGIEAAIAIRPWCDVAIGEKRAQLHSTSDGNSLVWEIRIIY